MSRSGADTRAGIAGSGVVRVAGWCGKVVVTVVTGLCSAVSVLVLVGRGSFSLDDLADTGESLSMLPAPVVAAVEMVREGEEGEDGFVYADDSGVVGISVG